MNSPDTVPSHEDSHCRRGGHSERSTNRTNIDNSTRIGEDPVADVDMANNKHIESPTACDSDADREAESHLDGPCCQTDSEGDGGCQNSCCNSLEETMDSERHGQACGIHESTDQSHLDAPHSQVDSHFEDECNGSCCDSLEAETEPGCDGEACCDEIHDALQAKGCCEVDVSCDGSSDAVDITNHHGHSTIEAEKDCCSHASCHDDDKDASDAPNNPNLSKNSAEHKDSDCCDTKSTACTHIGTHVDDDHAGACSSSLGLSDPHEHHHRAHHTTHQQASGVSPRHHHHHHAAEAGPSHPLTFGTGFGLRHRRRPLHGSREHGAPVSRGQNENEVMCPCCVKVMLNSNVSSLEAVMSKMAEAKDQFRRCCVAFADLCCAKSHTAGPAGGETCCDLGCQDLDGGLIPLLPVSSSRNYEPLDPVKDGELHSVPSTTDANVHTNAKDTVTLEVLGLHCADCLSKVTRAVDKLSGTKVIYADGVRGLVQIAYDSSLLDIRTIQSFTARASGFIINRSAGLGSDREKAFLLPVVYRRLPPRVILDNYEVLSLRPYSRTGWRKFLSREGRHLEGGEIDFYLRLDASNPPRPRDILHNLSPYGVSLSSPKDDQNHARINRDLASVLLRTLVALILTVPILVLVWAPTPLLNTVTANSTQLAIATLIVADGYPIYSGSFRSAYYLRRADLGVLASFSTLTSYIYSVIAFGFQVAGTDIGKPFFETVGLLVTLIFAGRALQVSTRKLGLRTIGDLGKLQPERVRILSNGEEVIIDARLLHYDDIMRVKPGEVIPTDGVVLRGYGTVDESSLTGEALPVPKSTGATVAAGTTLKEGTIHVLVTHLISENSIASILEAVSKAQSSGSDYQILADKMAGWLLPIATICCLAAFIGWMLEERFRRGQRWGEAVTSGVGYAIAIAAVSCPCALAIAVTLITSISMATTVREGVLFRSVQALLKAYSIKAIAFDKTGTLSQGVLTVQDSSYHQDPLNVRLIHCVTGVSKHPVSETVRRYIESHNDVGLDIATGLRGLDDIKVVPGQGVTGRFYGFQVKAGNAKYTAMENHPLVSSYLSRGMSILVITLGHQLIGLFGMKDRPRPGVQQLVKSLERSGMEVALVSGDNKYAVESFAQEVKISPDSTYSGQTPISKSKVIESLKATHSPGMVSFVGDGINDTVALSTADISIAIGSASSTSSDIIFLTHDIPKAIQTTLSTSYLTRNHVMVSLTCCGLYFTAAILLASGVTGWRIPPSYAGLGEMISIIPVLLVAGSFVLFKFGQRWLASPSG
ncbi:E1-E2 ATPase-domain-containing protein [Naematelia encephala]|uniref:E1-E2 ATPase-domain-containing protein n=1 Tax=Naematelia encephala TaxID=71784 RepID=A0A1Y2AN95_9TREE|nr:E1-E2 ATPase-domain-containing protein [Naematelia encephala]